MPISLISNEDLCLRSPIVSVNVHGQQFYIKRDDQLHPVFNGNKARKFLYYFYLDQPRIKTLISFGGNQSNAMLALSELAKMKNWKFDYYLKKLPQQLLDSPVGNFKIACENGMSYHEVSEFPLLQSSEDSLVIHQGGAHSEAEFGIAKLANEINKWIDDQQVNDCCIFLPSGTGTTAFYLQQHTTLPVYTTPCIGNAGYLQKQWQSLKSRTKHYPLIISSQQKTRFGKPHPEYLEFWHYLLDTTGIEFDLLYDPPGWTTLLNSRKTLAQNVIYIHCGGISGNESMLLRYNHLFKQTRQNVKHAFH